MPRNLEAIGKVKLIEELRTKHDIDTVAVEVPEPLRDDEGMLPEGVEQRGEVFVDVRPVEDVQADVILEHHGHVLDVMTDKEREEETARRIKKENEEALTHEEIEQLTAPPEFHPVLGGPRNTTVEAVVIKRWVRGDDGRPVQAEERMDDDS